MKKTLSIAPLMAVAAAAAILTSCKPSEAPSATPASTPAEKSATTTPAPEATKEAAAPVTDSETVAVVDGVKISKADLDKAVNEAIAGSGRDPSSITPEMKQKAYSDILDEMILDKLLDKASSSIVVSDDQVNEKIAEIKKQFPSEEAFEQQMKAAGQNPEKLSEGIRRVLQHQEWMKSQLSSVQDVDADEAKKFYQENQKEFANPELVKASHILFLVNKDDSPEVVKAKEAAAKKALARAKKEDFSTLARELSEEPAAKETGGDLGFFPKDRMVPEFATAAFAQKVGSVSGPVRTEFGWHVIKVTEKKPAGTMSFDEVKDQLINYLKGTKQRQAAEAVMKKLREDAKVENNLPPSANLSPTNNLPPSGE